MLSILLAAACTLQFDFPRAYEPSTFAVTLSAEPADLDGDPYPDLVINDDFAYVRFGKPGGRFGDAVALNGALATGADVDRDGRTDLIVSYNTPTGPRTGVRRNLGRGQFAPAVEVFGGGATWLVAGDFTNDGAPDVLVIRQQDQPAFLLNDGRGNFSVHWGAAPNLRADPANVRLVQGDLNGDGNLDLAGLSTHGHRRFLGNGTGYLAESLDSFPVFAAADFDGDGSDELVTTTITSSVAILRGNFTHDLSLQLRVAPPRAHPGDFNGDGAVDLAVSEENLVHVLLNDGRGGLTVASRFTAALTSYVLTTADVDADGDDDLIVPAGLGFGIVRSNGDGTFATWPRIAAGYAQGLVADVDGNGLDERIVVKDDRVVVVRGETEVEQIAAAPRWIADWDDETRELLTHTQTDLQIHQRQSNGTWTERLRLFAATSTATLGDFDGNGENELAVVLPPAPGAVAVRVLSRGGAVLFETPLPPNNAHIHLRAADLNADGRDDLVIVNGGSRPFIPHYFGPMPDGYVDVFLSTGTGFAAPVRFLERNAFDPPREGDFNGDGADDLALPNYRGEIFVLWGGAQLRTEAIVALHDDLIDTLYPAALAAGDITGDGFDDLAATYPDLNVHVFTGGAAGLAAHTTLVQPKPYMTPDFMRLAPGEPRALVLRDDDVAGEHYVLQLTCSYPRRRGVRH